jgi:3-hydroxyacyl-CoA dehydrogenase
MYIFKAAVVGAGTMGAELAQVISYSGLPVILKDVDQAMLDRGLDRIRAIYQGRVDKGKMTPSEMDSKLALVEGTLSFDGFGDVDLVIEAVPENMGLKQSVFGQLEEACPEGTLFATNTSALSISEMAAATRRPHKFVGMHFFNPAHVMKLVEVVPGLDTSQETVDDVVAFAESLRKLPVVVQECPGFLVNRLLTPYLNEATLCLQEGAASAAEIDQAMVEFGMAMGPFTTMDLVGLDVCGAVGLYLQSEYGERMRGAELFVKMIEAGRLGEKSGAGFYGYGDQSDDAIGELVAPYQVPGSQFSPERVMLPLINEAALCLQEKIAPASDIDLAMMAGTGMGYQGERMGPLAIADAIGLDVVLEQLRALHDQFGERFRPARPITLRVRAGHLGRKTGRGFHEYSA